MVFHTMKKSVQLLVCMALSSLFLETKSEANILSENPLFTEVSIASSIVSKHYVQVDGHAKLEAVTALPSNGKRNGSHPYVAYIYFQEGRNVWRCGGTLVAEDIVLTAAHCLPKGDSFYGSVTLGGYESYDNEPQENFRIMEIERHPGYNLNGYLDNDFAIAKLDRCSGIRPVSLNRSKFVDGEMLTVLVWKDTLNDEGFEQFTTIQESRVRLNQECEPWRSRRSLGTMTDNMLCASIDKNFSKHDTVPKIGDSGGALLRKGLHPEDDVQIGVVSFGYDKPGIPTVFANIEMSAPWIAHMTGTLSTCSKNTA